MDDTLYLDINKRNGKAWEELFKLYYAALCSYAYKIVKNNDLSEDITQETLVNIWHSQVKFNDMRHLTFYLYKAVYKNALYYLRSQKPIKLLDISDVENLVFDDEQFRITIKEELVRRLYEKIAQLPLQCRNVILMSIDGYSGQQIADALGISINTVKVHKKRAMEILRYTMYQSLIYIFL